MRESSGGIIFGERADRGDRLMPPATSPDETQAAVIAIKWVVGALGGLVVTGFTALFGWVWKTDRAVQRMVEAEARDREQRTKWREELLESIRALERRVTVREEEAAFERGRDVGRKERTGR